MKGDGDMRGASLMISEHYEGGRRYERTSLMISEHHHRGGSGYSDNIRL